jgi:hypothetical protein
MNSSGTYHWRFSVAMSSLLGFALTLGSASMLSGCGDDKGQSTMVEPKDSPADIAKDSMNFYKNAYPKGAAAKKK